jgi:hypothetical protein
MGKHTLLLVQTRGKSTRTYYDFDNETAAVTGGAGRGRDSKEEPEAQCSQQRL